MSLRLSRGSLISSPAPSSSSPDVDGSVESVGGCHDSSSEYSAIAAPARAARRVVSAIAEREVKDGRGMRRKRKQAGDG